MLLQASKGLPQVKEPETCFEPVFPFIGGQRPRMVLDEPNAFSGNAQQHTHWASAAAAEAPRFFFQDIFFDLVTKRKTNKTRRWRHETSRKSRGALLRKKCLFSGVFTVVKWTDNCEDKARRNIAAAASSDTDKNSKVCAETEE